MKSNAIIRIVLYSLLVIVLLGILLGGIVQPGLNYLINIHTGGTAVENEVTLDSGQIKNLEIDWAAGNVVLQTDDIDQITLQEIRPDGSNHKMTYQISGNTLKLSYGTAIIGFGNFSLPEKDLIVTVPRDWVCEELEIDGAALKVDVNGLSAQTIELDGAAMEFSITGTFRQLFCDGAGCVLDISAITAPEHISLDGAGCELQVILPEDCGFAVYAEGLGISVDSDVSSYYENGAYRYGNGMCRVDAGGLGCSIRICYEHTVS